jgi:tetratricopeptide (TPR) repeat protein
VDALRSSTDRAALAHALRDLGELERGRSADAARMRYEEAVSILRELDTPLTLAHTIRHLGDIYTKAGRHSLAEQCCEEAVAIYRTHSNASALDVANAIRSLAVVKERLTQLDQARQLWQDAHNRYAALNVVEGTAEAAAHLSRLTRNP